MMISLEATHRVTFATTKRSDGSLVAADSTPTVTIYEQGSAMGYSPTVTSLATGKYEVAIACTTSNGFEVGKEYTAIINATISGVVTARGGVSFRISDAESTLAATAAALLNALALLHHNSVLDQHVYSDGRLTSFRLRHFATAEAAADADTDAADGADGEVRRWRGAATYDEGALLRYQLVQEEVD